MLVGVGVGEGVGVGMALGVGVGVGVALGVGVADGPVNSSAISPDESSVQYVVAALTPSPTKVAGAFPLRIAASCETGDSVTLKLAFGAPDSMT
jgi:hypothetical protein